METYTVARCRYAECKMVANETCQCSRCPSIRETGFCSSNHKAAELERRGAFQWEKYANS